MSAPKTSNRTALAALALTVLAGVIFLAGTGRAIAPEKSCLADSQPPGLEAVVNALAVQRVDARGGIADQHPVAAGHARHRATHRQQC